MKHQTYIVEHDHGIQITYRVYPDSKLLKEFLQESSDSSKEFREMVTSWNGEPIKALLEKVSQIVVNTTIGLDSDVKLNFARMALYGNGGFLNTWTLDHRRAVNKPIEIVTIEVPDYLKDRDWTIKLDYETEA